MDHLLFRKPIPLNPLEEPRVDSYRPRAWWLRYGIPVAALALVLLIVRALWPYSYGSIFLFSIAVMISAWMGGLGPGVLATFLAIPLISYFALPPSDVWSLRIPELVLLGIFSVAGVFVSLLEESRRRNEELLQRSRDQFRVILQGIADGITAQDTSGRLIYANHAAAKLTGFASNEELVKAPNQEVLSRFQVFDENGRPFPLDQLPGRIALQEGQAQEATLRFRVLATGEERWSIVKARPILDNKGSVQLAINLFQDITALKQAEAALAGERERFRVTLASIGDGVIATDIGGQVEFMNPAAETLTGWQQAEAVGKPVGEVFHIVNEESRRQVVNPAARALSEGVVVGLANHTLLITRDGSEHPVDDSGAPIRNAAGETTGAVLIFRDVAERRQAEKVLQEAHARTVEILETLGDAFYALDHQWRFTYVNRQAEAYWGKRRDELLGRMIWEEFPQVIGTRSEQEQRRAARERQPIAFETISPVLGRWIEVRIYPSASGLSVYFRDISTRKQVEIERTQLMLIIDQQRQRLENILANIPGVVWESRIKPGESNPPVDFVSDYAQQMLGYSVEEWLETPNFWLTIVHPDDHARTAAEATVIFTERQPGVSRFRWVAKDGREIPVEAHSTVICDESDQPIGTCTVAIDISKRVRAEEALRTSEALYRTLMEAMPQFVWSITNDGVLTYGNKLCTEYTGVTVEEINELGWGHVIHPDDLPTLFGNLRLAFESDEAQETELRFRRADGGYRWFIHRVVPVTDAGGQILNWLATSTDIHERKLAEDERTNLLTQLEQQSRRLNDLIANVPGVVWESWGAPHPGEGTITFVSEYIVNLLGYPLEMWLTVPDFHYSILHPEDRSQYIKQVGDLFKSGKAGKVQFRWLAQDGRPVWVVSHQMSILDEFANPVGLRGVTIDVTARKEAEERLRQNEERLRLVLENMPILLSVNNEQGNRIVWNKEAERVTGYSAEEIVDGKRRGELFYPDPDYRAWVDAELEARQADFRDLELRTVCKDSSTRVISWSNISRHYPIPGWPDWALGVDVTERKLVEERMTRLQTVTAALSQALTPAQVVEVILDEGAVALGISAGAVMLLVEQGNMLEIIRAVGYSQELVRVWRRISTHVQMPMSETARTAAPCFIESPEMWKSLYPHSPIPDSPEHNAWVTIPLIVNSRVLGVMILSFDTPRQVPNDERTFMLVLAHHCAQALERARLYDGERQARDEAEAARQRLQFLAESSALLASSLDYEETLERLAQLAVETIADWCVIDMLEEGGVLRRLAVVHSDPAKQELARELQRRYPALTSDQKRTAAEVLRANRSWLDPDVSDTRLAMEARDDEHLRILRELGFKSEMVVPLTAHDMPIGAITLVLGESDRRYSRSDLELAEELARRASAAVDNAWLYRQAKEARADAISAAARMTRLQAVTAALSQSLTTDEIAEVILNQGLEALDALAGSVYLLRDTELEVVRAVGYSQSLMDAWRRISPDSSVPIADAVRTGRPVWLSSEEERAALYPEIATVATRPTGSWAAIPLLLNERVIGALGLSFAFPQAFTEDDKAFIMGLAQQCVQALERARLYEMVRRDQQRQTFLAEATAMLASSLDYELTIQSVAFLAVPVITDWCSVYVVSDDGSSIEQLAVAHSDPVKVAGSSEVQWRYPPDPDAPRGVWNVLRTGQTEFYPVITDELLASVSRDEEHLRLMREVGLMSAMIVPLVARGRTVGAMTFISAESGRRYDPADDLSLVQELARRAAIAVDNSRLYHQVQQQRLLSEALRDTALVLSSTLDLSEVLDQILANLGRVVPHDVADIMFIEDGVARIERSQGYVEHGLAASEDEIMHLRMKVDDVPNFRWIVEHKRPMAVEDTQNYKEWVIVHRSNMIRSSISAPILIDNEVIGFINVNSLMPGFFTTHGETLQVFANQAAVAIRNARLYQQAQKLAALEERQRLARELHDAVSQTLFSASVIAESLPRLWEREPSRVLPKLLHLSRLNRGALAEMRTLLLELRPAALLNSRLGDLVTQLAEAVKGRREVAIALDIHDQRPLPPDVHIAFYRIIQEALNNTVKHAQASEIKIFVRNELQRVEVRIGDNGSGFEPEKNLPGMGLASMRERADAIGATLEITSSIGDGTEISVVWSAVTSPSAS